MVIEIAGEGRDPSARWVLTAVYPRPGRPVECVFLSGGLVGLHTHWLTINPPHGRSVLCTKHTGSCQHCPHSPRIWCAYGSAACWTPAGIHAVLLSDQAVADLLRINSPSGRATLRGMAARLSRPKSSPFGGVHAEPLERQWTSPLPPAPDLWPMLERLYGPAVRDLEQRPAAGEGAKK